MICVECRIFGMVSKAHCVGRAELKSELNSARSLWSSWSCRLVVTQAADGRLLSRLGQEQACQVEL